MFKIIALMMLVLGLATLKSKGQNSSSKKSIPACSSDCKADNKEDALICKLTTPQLQERKETVIESLKSQILQKKELSEGYAFRFPGTDKMLDELIEFIKTERECCEFFVFGLSVSGDKSETWLELTGPKGAKDFILTELKL